MRTTMLAKLRPVSALVCALLIVLPVTAGRYLHSDGSDAKEVHGFNIANLDTTCKPCDDFNQFANGGWMAANPIPPAYPSWGSFNALAEKNTEKLKTILVEASSKTNEPKGSKMQEIGDFYASGMAEDQIEKEGLKPLAGEFSKIDAVHDPRSLQVEVAHLHEIGVASLFRFGPGPDLKDSKMVIANVGQGGLSLPDRDYYLKDDAKSKELRDQYVKHVSRLFQLLGDSASKSDEEAATVMTVETAISQASKGRVQMRDPENNYHKMALSKLQEMTPSILWTQYIKDAGAPAVTEINVGQPDFLTALDHMISSTSMSDWKVYLRWHLVEGVSEFLPNAFAEENFSFNGKVLTGAKEMQPRWKRVVQSTDRLLGQPLGQIYVERYFPPEARARALEMVNNMIAVLRTDLGTLSWMGDATRKQAIAKLDAFTKKIGYPDKWDDYSKLKIDRSSYLWNSLRARQFAYEREIVRIGHPPDKSRWGMTPPTVNAYYNSQSNEIVFPAGIMQPPFFDPQADDAINYGGMGAVIGHEMSHGFDDQGSKFDGSGNLVNWWSPEDLKNFQSRAECVVHQFDGYFVEPNLHENGKLVVGESIGDLGGLTLAYAALQKSMEGKPRPANIDGFTPEQRFFLGWAQVWAGNNTPEFARLMVNTNPHPLGKFRVDGPLSNMPAFSNAFHCKEGDKMVRPASERCQIW